MRKAGEVLKSTTFENSGRTPQLTGLSPDILQRLARLMKSARNYLGNQPISEEQAEEYAGDWVKLVKQYGLQRFEDGLVLARQWVMEPDGEVSPRKFFPLPSEIEQFISSKTESPTKLAPDPNCPDCIPDWRGFERVDWNTVRRCHCQKQVAR